jgi:hypothetical protein
MSTTSACCSSTTASSASSTRDASVRHRSRGGGTVPRGPTARTNGLTGGPAEGGGTYPLSPTAEIDNSTLNDAVGGGLVNDHSTIHLKTTVVDGVLYTNQDYP